MKTAIRSSLTEEEVADLLREHGISVTPQRVAIACVLFKSETHLSAEEIHRAVNALTSCVSKATVYNTLGLLTQKGLVRAVVADPAHVSYDPNTCAHHHFYDETSGELSDINASEVQIAKLPALPDGAELQGIDVIIRVRRAKTST